MSKKLKPLAESFDPSTSSLAGLFTDLPKIGDQVLFHDESARPSPVFRPVTIVDIATNFHTGASKYQVSRCGFLGKATWWTTLDTLYRSEAQ